MILTGKCKEDFEKWSREVYDNDGIDDFGKRLFYISSLDDYKFIETDHYIYNIGDSMLNALIIEFFDSVGIIINTYYNTYSNGFVYELILNEKIVNTDNNFKCRKQSKEQAIIHANKIYNETKA